MILITGGAGFIGSNLVNELISVNSKVVVCDFKEAFNEDYFANPNEIVDFIHPKDLEKYIENNNIEIIFHLGAISSTTCNDGNRLWLNNILLSSKIWKWCATKKIRLIYASSAATYGNGELGFIDNNEISYINSLKPLNVYAWTKNEIDRRNIVLDKYFNYKPNQWVALKFFNVYGPNESHKQNMISIALKTFQQIKKNNSTKLFKSYNKNYNDGEQKRDFIYVKDCIKVLVWFMKHANISGIFNVGTGISRTFNDLVSNVYKTMNKNINITYIDMPNNIKKQYQYKTKADINNLKNVGYQEPFYSLEEGIKDYIQNYLNKKI